MPQAPLLQDLAVIMAVAAAATLLCHRIRQPVVLGYIVAGLIVGPHTPPFALVRDLHSIHTLSELGLVFLMFGLGLEFNLPKLGRVGLSAAMAAALQVGAMYLLGFELARFFGWSRTDGVFLGAIVSISSTTIIVKLFSDLGLARQDFAQVVFGILIFEDIVAVLILSLLPGTETDAAPGAGRAVGVLLRVAFFGVFFLTAGLSLVPRLLRWAARFRSAETTGVVTLGLCLSGAALAHAAGFSVALGAFLAGAVAAASSEADGMSAWFHPVRDMFAALFFVAVGMLLDPRLLWTHRVPILATALVVVVGKILSVSLGCFLAGYNARDSVKSGMSLAQIGEFSFVIAGLGTSSGLVGEAMFPLAVGVSSLTTLLTPWLIRRADGLADVLARRTPRRFAGALEAYRAWFLDRRLPGGKAAEGLAFSRYWARLAVYAALFTAALLLARALALALELWSGRGPFWTTHLPAALWVLASLLCLPLMAALARYCGHVVLLAVTMTSPWLLGKINVHVFYRMAYASALLLLAGLATAWAWPFFPSAAATGWTFLGVTAAAALGRRLVAKNHEALERLLDEVLGLATSEPARRAILKTGERTLLLTDVAEELAVPWDSPATGKTLKELKLRERTGASLVAVYRHGEHIANPAADTRILPGDVVILLGSEEERRQASALIKHGTPAAE